VIRTRVGYCGGATESPTYQRIGDHSETIEIDYDPRVITYDDLLAEFFAGHDPRVRAFSSQYRSAVFYRTDEEWAAAEKALHAAEVSHGLVHTSIEPLVRFWIAEDYHQKFRLRGHSRVADELRALMPDERAFIDSTSAARLNAWVDGWGGAAQVERELPLTGLSRSAQDEVLAFAGRREHADASHKEQESAHAIRSRTYR
jgi:peptide-methionine (S)-S-oxide reductase